MKYAFFFLAVILLSGCKFNGKNRIRFVDIEQDAEAQALWRPDGGEKQEESSYEDKDDYDAGISDGSAGEPSTWEACSNSCYAMYGEECHSPDTCVNMNTCMSVCDGKFGAPDADISECANSCYARFGCHGDLQCQDLLVTCLLDCGEEIFPHDAQ